MKVLWMEEYSVIVAFGVGVAAILTTLVLTLISWRKDQTARVEKLKAEYVIQLTKYLEVSVLPLSKPDWTQADSFHASHHHVRAIAVMNAMPKKSRDPGLTKIVATNAEILERMSVQWRLSSEGNREFQSSNNSVGVIRSALWAVVGEINQDLLLWQRSETLPVPNYVDRNPTVRHFYRYYSEALSEAHSG